MRGAGKVTEQKEERRIRGGGSSGSYTYNPKKDSGPEEEGKAKIRNGRLNLGTWPISRPGMAAENQPVLDFKSRGNMFCRPTHFRGLGAREPHGQFQETAQAGTVFVLERTML